MQKKYEEEGHAKAVAQDNLIAADRKANANQNALEEVRTLLEQADRNRKYPQLWSKFPQLWSAKITKNIARGTTDPWVDTITGGTL